MANDKDFTVEKAWGNAIDASRSVQSNRYSGEYYQ